MAVTYSSRAALICSGVASSFEEIALNAFFASAVLSVILTYLYSPFRNRAINDFCFDSCSILLVTGSFKFAIATATAS